MFRLSELSIIESRKNLKEIPEGKVLINTINAHSYNIAQKNEAFAESLANGDYIIPDGASIVKACRWLKAKSQPKERIAGWDLFSFEMERLNENGNKNNKKRVMFVGSSEDVLEIIRRRVEKEYTHLEAITYSPPFKAVFSDEDNRTIVEAINNANPNMLWIGMTAPKQETWIWQHWPELHIHCHAGAIGAVFDFYAGSRKRAPRWMQEHSLEWLYRLVKEPKRMWRRYILGNPLFMWNIMKEKLTK